MQMNKATNTTMTSHTVKQGQIRIMVSSFIKWRQLTKLPISFAVAVTAVAGYLIRLPAIDKRAIWVFSGTFFLACGASILNNFQDRHFDRQFTRTKNRPFPRHQVSSFHALFIAAGIIVLGLLILFQADPSGKSLVIGLASLIMYNGIYSPWKKKSILAIIPGAVCGMLPPLIGWISAGGSVGTFRIWVLMTTIGLWQLPHFWFLILRNAEEYESAASPNILHWIDTVQLKRVLYIWMASFSCMILFFPATGLILTTIVQMASIIYVLLTVLLFSYVLFFRDDNRYESSLFMWCTASMGIILFLILLDRFLVSSM